MDKRTFYQSRQWRKLSRLFLQSKFYICERCGRPAEIAHHKQHITANNIDNPVITLNPGNLEALCMDCHNKEHFGSGGATAAGYHFNEYGEIIPDEERGEKL